ncbi:MAG: RDD family protein [Erysipelotrichaceae bacterium]|nr:RDD family protein [Erysipelotrichaceae bacterium]
MRVSGKSRSFEIEPNSSPYLLKRMIADGFDIVTLFFLFMLVTWLIMKTPLASTYNMHAETCRGIQNRVLEQVNNDLYAAREILSNDQQYADELFAANLHGFILKMISCLIAEAVLFLIIPLSNKAGATCGRLMTGIMLFNEQRQSLASKLRIFARFIFIFLFESVSLYIWTGIYTFMLVPVLRFIVMMLNKKHKTVCDLLTGTTMIEKLSYRPLD